VRELTELNEAPLPQPWAVDDAPADYLEKMLRGIVGVELTVESLVGKRKLSQNRPAADQAGIVAGLDATRGRGAASIADAMRNPAE
jgi:transcriptional regulator